MSLKTLIATVFLCISSIVHATTLIDLTFNPGASYDSFGGEPGGHFEGSVAGLFNDPFSYNPNNPTSTFPVTEVIQDSGNGWHELDFFGGDVFLTLDLNHTIVAEERDFAVDFWGVTKNDRDGDFATRDDNFEIYLLADPNHTNAQAIVSMTGLGIDNNLNNAHHRSTFEDLAIGTQIRAIRINFKPSGSNNIGSVMELRAATISQVPEPGSLTLCSLAGITLLLRRRR